MEDLEIGFFDKVNGHESADCAVEDSIGEEECSVKAKGFDGAMLLWLVRFSGDVGNGQAA